MPRRRGRRGHEHSFALVSRGASSFFFVKFRRYAIRPQISWPAYRGRSTTSLAGKNRARWKIALLSRARARSQIYRSAFNCRSRNDHDWSKSVKFFSASAPSERRYKDIRATFHIPQSFLERISRVRPSALFGFLAASRRNDYHWPGSFPVSFAAVLYFLLFSPAFVAAKRRNFSRDRVSNTHTRARVRQDKTAREDVSFARTRAYRPARERYPPHNACHRRHRSRQL